MYWALVFPQALRGWQAHLLTQVSLYLAFFDLYYCGDSSAYLPTYLISEVTLLPEGQVCSAKALYL